MINHHYPILNVPVTTNQIMSIGLCFSGGQKKPGGPSSSCVPALPVTARTLENAYGGQRLCCTKRFHLEVMVLTEPMRSVLSEKQKPRKKRHLTNNHGDLTVLFHLSYVRYE